MATLVGGNGNDTITDVFNSTGGGFATAGADSIAGLLGDDLLSGGGGADTIAGGKGFDTILGGGGSDLILLDGDSLLDNDSIDGGPAFDTFDFRGWVTLPYLRLDLAAGLLQASNVPGSWFTIAQLAPGSMENAIGSAFGDLMISDNDGNAFQGLEGADSLFGGAGNDSLSGGVGDDSLTGGDGADTIVPGAGADTLDGGAGTDWLSYADATEGVNVALVNGSAIGGRGAAGDVISGIENLLGSAYADSLSGAEAGANLIRGGAGADTLEGGAGDTLEGGDGADVYILSPSNLSAINEFGGDGARDLLRVVLSAGDSAVLPIAIEDMVLAEPGLDLNGDGAVGIGSSVANRMQGGPLDDTLLGMYGDDTLQGGGGADLLIGGPGRDLYVVEDASDAVAAEGDANDTIEASVSYGLSGTGALRLRLAPGAGDLEGRGGGGNETIDGNEGANTLSGGAGDDSLAGNAGDDRLVGGAGNDKLDGGPGSDRLFGGAGNDLLVGDDGPDVLRGDAGADMFVLNTVQGSDRILDFDRLQGDVIVLQGFPSDFVTNLTGRATAARAQIIYETDVGRLWFDSDGTGPEARILLATLVGAPTLTAADIVF